MRLHSMGALSKVLDTDDVLENNGDSPREVAIEDH